MIDTIVALVLDVSILLGILVMFAISVKNI